MTDRLLEHVAAGRDDGIEACIQRYGAVIRSLARKYLRSEHDAEDAVQDILLELWRNAHRFDPTRGTEAAFVTTIARRRLIDRLRRQRQAPPTEGLEVPEALPSEPRADQAALDEQAALVHAALDQLRPEQREVLDLSLLQGHSHQQVAERTRLPLGTVKSHARRGLMRVRELLGIPPAESGTEAG